MKKILLAASLASMWFAATPAMSFAADSGNFFINGDAGRADPDIRYLDTGNYFGLNSGYRWQVNPQLKLGVEGGYSWLGSFDATGGISGSAKIKGWTLGGNLHYNVTPNWYFSARLGAIFANETIRVPYGELSNDDTGSYVGVGLGYDFSSQFGVGLNYNHYDVKGDKVNALSLNGEVRF